MSAGREMGQQRDGKGRTSEQTACWSSSASLDWLIVILVTAAQGTSLLQISDHNRCLRGQWVKGPAKKKIAPQM